jgi:hypothetical protein
MPYPRVVFGDTKGERDVGHNDNRFSRRQIVSGLGVGFAATVVRPTLVENVSQPWPGLASKMDPRPDHGETSYRGSGRLAGRKALVTGGDSGMGRAAAIAYAREGADVAINYLPAEEPDAREVVSLIEKEGRVCVPIPGDLREKPFASDWYLKRCEAWAGSISSSVMGADNRPMTPSLTFPLSNSTGR